MATVKVVILKHQLKQDGTWNVKIRVTQGKESTYISTSHFVTARQLKKDYTLKDIFVIDLLAPVIAEYRKKIGALGIRGDHMSAKEIAAVLTRREDNEGVDFSKFCRDHIAELASSGRIGSADNMRTVYNSLCDFFGSETFYASDIKYRSLMEFESFLRKPRTCYRKGNRGQLVAIKTKGAGDAGVHNVMRDLRIMFNLARALYNDEETGVFRIPHYPFAKYKIGDAPLSKKRTLDISTIIAIRDAPVTPGSRAELARDVFMLSFYLCGMNSVDLYKLTSVKDGRVEYMRSKTTKRRKDKAFISLSVPDPAAPLLDKYIGSFQVRYNSARNFNKALNIGLKEIGKEIGVTDLEFYCARHTFGDTARNKCRFSKDDVALALNHIDNGRKTTDIYIRSDWSIVDEVQAGVIALLERDEPKVIPISPVAC